MKTSPSPRLTTPQRVAFVSGLIALLLGLGHLAAYALMDDAVWSGPIGFRKPAVFGVSIGVTLWSVGWLLTHLRPRPRLHAWVVGVMSGALLIEMAVISLQRFRGVPSHFNMATVVDGVLWTVMGLAIVIFALLAVLLAVLSLERLPTSPVLSAAIRGSLLIFVAAQLSGQIIVVHGSNVVFENGHFVSENLSRAATVGGAGNLKLPHAVALHAIQVIPLLALWILRLPLRCSMGIAWVWMASLGYLGVVGVTQYQAVMGRAVGDLGPDAAFLLLASLAGFVLPWLLAGGATVRHCLSSQRGVKVTFHA